MSSSIDVFHGMVMINNHSSFFYVIMNKPNKDAKGKPFHFFMRKTVAKQWQRHFVCYNVNMENIKPYDMQLDLVCNYCVLNIKADFKHTIRSNNAIEFKAEIDKVFTDYLQTITEAYEDGKLSKFKYDELRLRSNMARKTYSEEVDKLIK